MAKRSRHSFEFKKKVVEEFEKGLGTAQELGRKHGVHPISIYQWKKKCKSSRIPALTGTSWCCAGRAYSRACLREYLV